MTEEEIRAALFRAIRKVAPGTEPEHLAGDADIREELDIDSMDFLNVMLALHADLGVDIPERDYLHLFSMNDAVACIAKLVAQRG